MRRLFRRALSSVLIMSGIAFALHAHPTAGNEANAQRVTPPPAVASQTPVPPAPAAITPPPDADAEAPPLSPPDVKAVSAILVDAVSGQVLYEKNADAHRPMASTTKIMTALLFCEAVKEGEVITASKKACAVRESSLHLKVGEKLNSHDLLCAILMRSANDGCVDAAEYVAGSEADFVARMNKKAAELGATNTHFMNPHGLNDPQHYTTARDLATIARAAMQQERIREVVKTEKCRITRSIDKNDVTMRNHSHFLGHYQGADGVKTGWTVPAGHCYVGSATRNGWQLISVVLKSPDYVHETAQLMDYGFKNFAPHELAKAGEIAGQCVVQHGEQPAVSASIPRALQYISRKGETPVFTRHLSLIPAVAPVLEGHNLGSMEVLLNGRQIASSPLVAVSAIPVARPVVQAHAGSSGRFAAFVGIFAAVLVSLRYGTRQKTRFTPFAKGPRRRRRRFAPSLRDNDFRG